MRRAASCSAADASLFCTPTCAAARNRRHALPRGGALRSSVVGALALALLLAGSARAQTTTLIDTSLTIPVFAQTINFQVTGTTGAQFIVGSGIFNPADEGIGFLSGPNGYFQVFALTNGTINADVFETFTLTAPGAYSFTYTFANANGTSGDQLALAATVTPLAPPNPCASVTCAPSDQCHVAGVCDSTTGQCSNPTAADGTTCTGSGGAGLCETGACATPPSAPAAPTVSAGNTAVTVTWVAPASNGSAILSYTVQPYLGTTALTPVTVETTTAVITGLSNGDSYTFTVYATNGVGSGPASPPSTAAIPDPSCGVGQTLCENQCTVLSSDPDNCGACGNVCASGQVCAAGACAAAVAANIITTGADFTCVERPSGNVYCWGENTYGQLGNGTAISSDTPVQVTGLSNVAAIYATGFSACAVLESGAVQCWGENNQGQLGNGSTANSAVPVPVSGLTNAISVAGVSYDDAFVCAVQSTGNVSCWGGNTYGELGNGTKIASAVPVQVVGLSDALAVATSSGPSGNFACALVAGGTVSCWGTLPWLGSSIAVQAVPGATGFVGLAPVFGGMCGLTSGGSVECWGVDSNPADDNVNEQLGTVAPSNTPKAVQGPTGSGVLSNITAISGSVGSQYTSVCAAQANGSVYCWGQNGDGELGNGSEQTTAVPTLVSGLKAAVQTSIGGGNNTGRASACSVLSTGAVVCWGDNSDGELGDGNTKSSSTPVSVIDLGN